MEQMQMNDMDSLVEAARSLSFEEYQISDERYEELKKLLWPDYLESCEKLNQFWN